MKYSKKTEQARAEIIVLRGEIEKLQRPIAKCLADDNGDIDKVGAQLSTLRAKVDILQARIGRRQVELYEMVKADARLVVDEAIAANNKACDQLRELKAQWKASIEETHGKEGAVAILKDDAFRPLLIKDAQRKVDETTAARMTAEADLQSIDSEAFCKANPNRVDPQYYAMNPQHQRPDFYRAAGKLCPELDGMPSAAVKAGTQVTGI